MIAWMLIGAGGVIIIALGLVWWFSRPGNGRKHLWVWLARACVGFGSWSDNPDQCDPRLLTVWLMLGNGDRAALMDNMAVAIESRYLLYLLLNRLMCDTSSDSAARNTAINQIRDAHNLITSYLRGTTD